MKRFILVALVAACLTACASGPNTASLNCADGICVKLQVVEPVRLGQPTVFTITVTSDQDQSDLGVTLYSGEADVVVEGPQGWESNARDGMVWRAAAGWKFSARAKTPVVFTRVVRFPAREGYLDVIAALHAGPRNYMAFDTIRFDLAPASVTIYRAGTPYPTNPAMRRVTPAPPVNAQGTVLPIPTTAPTPTVPPLPTRALTPTRRPYP